MMHGIAGGGTGDGVADGGSNGDGVACGSDGVTGGGSDDVTEKMRWNVESSFPSDAISKDT
jgi:hypothetical protein